MRVNCLADCGHGLDFQRRFIAFDLFGFQTAKAVFRRDGAVIFGHYIVNHLRAFFPAGNEGRDVFANTGNNVVVQVAVTDMAKA